MTLGCTSSGSGAYTLSGAASKLSATTEYVGYSGTGSFTQAGGINTVSNLYLGYNSGAAGSYNLSDGSQLSAHNAYVGYSGTGTFTQTGGSTRRLQRSLPGLQLGRRRHLRPNRPARTSVGTLYLGYNSGAAGTYKLSGTGQLSTPTRIRRLLLRRHCRIAADRAVRTR